MTLCSLEKHRLLEHDKVSENKEKKESAKEQIKKKERK